MDLVALGLAVWSRWLWRRPGAPSWLRWVSWVLLVGFVVSLGGTVLGLRLAFGSVESVDPSQKATVLAASISRAMAFTAAGLVLDAVVFVVLLVVALRLRRASPPMPPRE